MTSVIGKRIPKYDGLSHVEGKTTFVDDLVFSEMLHTKVGHSPFPNAKILNIDTGNASKVKGVVAVITHSDVPVNRYGMIPDQPVLADDYARYVGQPIAAVAAVDEETAAEAVERILVEYEPLQPVFDPLESMQPGAPLIHEGGNVAPFGDQPFRRIRLGDVAEGFAQSDLIVEGVYTTQSMEHAPIEPHVGVAVPDSNGKITIYTVSQAVFRYASTISGILGVSPDKVRLVGGTVGGGFGGKMEMGPDAIIAILAQKTGKPVKWRWTRQEEFLISTTRNPWRMEFKDGVKRDGRIVARQVRTIQDTGAYNHLGNGCMDKHCIMIRGPYNIPSFAVDGFVVYTNKQPTGAFRGYGVAQATFGFESQMDKIAEVLDLDPLELRLKNALRDGDVSSTGQMLTSVAVVDTLAAAAKAAGWPLPAVKANGEVE